MSCLCPEDLVQQQFKKISPRPIDFTPLILPTGETVFDPSIRRLMLHVLNLVFTRLLHVIVSQLFIAYAKLYTTLYCYVMAMVMAVMPVWS